MIDVIFRISILLIAAASYVAWAAWARVKSGLFALFLVWVGGAAVYGYLHYRWLCSQPLTCDVFVTGGPSYFELYTPPFTIVNLCVFSIANILIIVRHRRGADHHLVPVTVGLGAIAIVIGWIAGDAVLRAMRILS